MSTGALDLEIAQFSVAAPQVQRQRQRLLLPRPVRSPAAITAAFIAELRAHFAIA